MSGNRTFTMIKPDAVESNNIGNIIHVINAPSPAATSSLAIGDYIANIYLKK